MSLSIAGGFVLGFHWGSLPTPIILIFDSMEDQWRQATLGSAQWQNKKQWAQNQTQMSFLLNVMKHFLSL